MPRSYPAWLGAHTNVYICTLLVARGGFGDGVGMRIPARIGILTVSDRASRGEYADEGGPAIRSYLAEVLTSPWEPLEQIVPDDIAAIATAIRDMAAAGCCLVVTTGGTGPAPRDVTPEATEQVCTKMLPGFGELMRQVSLQYVPTAILSRQTAGVCGGALVVNLPGQPKSIRECLGAVFPAIPYCIDLIHTDHPAPPRLETDPTRLVAFRPRG
jgi:molybdopterin adenylyltransferase